jgi:type VI secretion system protein VasG
MFGEYQVRTGHLIVGFLNSELRHKFLAISREFAKIKLEELTDNFAKIVSGSPEDSLRASDGSELLWSLNPDESCELPEVVPVCPERVPVLDVGKPLRFGRDFR